MMHTKALAALSGLFAHIVLAQNEPFSFCKDNQCADCPLHIASSGTGYPACVTYNSDDVFKGQGFPGSDGGGYRPYLDIPEPEAGCKVLVKSPADTTIAYCGYLKGAFGHAACAVLDIEKSFMVQFCCGLDQCKEAGAAKRIRRSARFGDVTVVEELDADAFKAGAAGGGMFSYKLRSANGSVIEPAAIGYPPEAVTAEPAVVAEASRSVKVNADPPKGTCDGGSWVPDAGKEDYTKPAPNTQIVLGQVDGGSNGNTVTITSTREQSWSTTATQELGFADIISMGISFSETYEESISDSKAYTFNVPSGQKGSVGFTAFLECTTGHGRCHGEDVSGEVCVPYTVGDSIAGIYAVIANS